MALSPRTDAQVKIIEANLNRELSAVKLRTATGLVKACAHIRNETEKSPPLTPVDYGNLRASWFVATASRIAVGRGTSKFKGPKGAKMIQEHTATVTEAQGIVKAKEAGKGIVVMAGYTANYALYVHENMTMHNPNNPYWKRRKKGWRKGSGPKWFETALKRNTGKIIQIVKENAQIKG